MPATPHEVGDLGDPGGVNRGEGEDEPRRRGGGRCDGPVDLVGDGGGCSTPYWHCPTLIQPVGLRRMRPDRSAQANSEGRAASWSGAGAVHRSTRTDPQPVRPPLGGRNRRADPGPAGARPPASAPVAPSSQPPRGRVRERVKRASRGARFTPRAKGRHAVTPRHLTRGVNRRPGSPRRTRSRPSPQHS